MPYSRVGRKKMPGKVRPETHLLNRAWGKLRDIENWIALWNSAGDANGFEGEGYLEPEGAAQYATYLRQETDGVDDSGKARRAIGAMQERNSCEQKRALSSLVPGLAVGALVSGPAGSWLI
jgi:hypothetical protein